MQNSHKNTTSTKQAPDLASLQNIINEFFFYSDAEDAREDLFDLYRMAMESKTSELLDPTERNNLGFALKKIGNLLRDLEAYHTEG